MTGNHLPRLYVAAGTIVVFFVLWATVAAHPWATASQATPEDPRLLALARREKALRVRAETVKHVVDVRWTAYEKRLRRRQWDNEVALQRHLRELEASQAAALRAAHAYQTQALQAQAYASRVVAWANAHRIGRNVAVRDDAGRHPDSGTRHRRRAARKGSSRRRQAERGFRGRRPDSGSSRRRLPGSPRHRRPLPPRHRQPHRQPHRHPLR